MNAHSFEDEFNFLVTMAQIASKEIAKKEKRAWDMREGFFILEADELRILLNQFISVGTFAVIENHCRWLGGEAEIALSERPQWGEIRTKIEKYMNNSFDNFPEFSTVENLRILSNCFKHKSGWPSMEMVRKSNRPDLIDGEKFVGSPDYVRTIFWTSIDIFHNIYKAERFLTILTNTIRLKPFSDLIGQKLKAEILNKIDTGYLVIINDSIEVYVDVPDSLNFDIGEEIMVSLDQAKPENIIYIRLTKDG